MVVARITYCRKGDMDLPVTVVVKSTRTQKIVEYAEKTRGGREFTINVMKGKKAKVFEEYALKV